jgi:hypothetical protein
MTENTQAIWAALAGVQRELRTQPHTRSVNVGKYGYTYTELSALCDYLLPLLGAAGIATTYTSRLAGETALEIECRLTACDGSSVASSVFMSPEAWDPQSIGKSVTYGRRYTLQMATGIATEEDTDCAEAKGKATHAAKTAPAPAPAYTIAPAREPERLVPPPSVPVAVGPRPQQTEGAAAAVAANAITAPQRGKIFARVKELLPADATDDEVRALCTKTAMDMFHVTVSGLTKKRASAVIEWLDKADVESLTDKIPF